MNDQGDDENELPVLTPLGMSERVMTRLRLTVNVRRSKKQKEKLRELVAASLKKNEVIYYEFVQYVRTERDAITKYWAAEVEELSTIMLAWPGGAALQASVEELRDYVREELRVTEAHEVERVVTKARKRYDNLIDGLQDRFNNLVMEYDVFLRALANADTDDEEEEDEVATTRTISFPA